MAATGRKDDGRGGWRRRALALGTGLALSLTALVGFSGTAWAAPMSCTTTATTSCSTVMNTFTASHNGTAGQSISVALDTAQVVTTGPGSWNVSACPSGLAGMNINWGDGTTSPPNAAAPLDNGALPVSGQHVYTQPGDYSLSLASVDAGCASESLSEQITTITIGMFVMASHHNLSRDVGTRTARIAAAPPVSAGSAPSSGTAGTTAGCTKKKKKRKKRRASAAKKKKKKKKKC